MFRLFTCFFVQFFIFQLCLCDLALEKKEKILNSFIDYLKNLPDQPYVLRDGVLSNIIELNDNSYYLETQIKAEDSGNPSLRYVKCTGTVYDRPESGIEVANNYQCHEDAQSHIFNQFEDVVTERMSDSTVELSGRHQPIQLDNEVQTEPVSSGEQFIAVPRDRSPCIGCASQVNPEAAGVSDLALLGVNQLNVLEPSVKHSLNKVVEVERQVQVVNGIRYILTILVDYNSCADTVSETCIITKTCKISVLDKPWIRLPNGTKYRVVVSNNCTEAWLFEDHDSEHNLDKPHDSQQPTPNYNNIPNIGTIDEIIKNVHSPDVQAQPEIERTLTDEEIRNIEQQIIPNIQLKKIPHNEQPVTTAYEDTSTYRAEEVSNVESKIHVQETERNTQVPTSISEDKKKAIDDLLTFFDYAGLNKKSESDDDSLRVRRSYEKDLNFLNLAEKFNQMKKSIDNAKLLYTYAQSMVDYLNEMDIEVKNRILNHVISAEEELENNQHFFYIKALVVIPCEKVECDGKDKLAKICNSVIDGTNERSPQILTTFCYKSDDSKVTNIGKINIVPSDDPILSKLANTALKHIEDQSPEFNALQIVKIISANTQKLSGTLTKLSMIIGRTNCNKTIIFTKRSNCSLLKQMGSKVCDVEILERQWLKDKSISYTCINRAIEESFSSGNVSKTRINDPDVLEILQEAIQYLNIQSNKNNKQKVVDVISVTTQLAAGLLTNIQFTVGYTVCKNDQFVDLKDCELIDNESVRNCYVQVWHRPWLEDGRQVNVSCEKAAPDINDKDTQTLRQNMRLEIREKRQVLGGEMEQNISDPKYSSMANESLQKYLQMIGSSNAHRVVSIDKVITQIVTGSLTKIDFTVGNSDTDVMKCHSEVWERSWLNKKDIDVKCNIEDRVPRKKRGIPGGVMEQNSNDPKYKALAEESLQKYIQTTGSAGIHRIVTVDKVTTQIVSGLRTVISFTVSNSNADVIKCHADVLEKSWLNKKDIDVKCNIEDRVPRKKRGIPGGVMEQNSNDPKYKALAEESLQKYLQTTGSAGIHRIVTVDKVTTQVVSGLRTVISFTVSNSNADVIKCHADILEKSWLNKKYIDVKCNIEDKVTRKKRGIPGGVMEQNSNDPKYKALAEESLQKYIQTTGSAGIHRIVTVDKVTTQIVSGLRTVISFTVSNSNADVIKCHSDVLEKSWLNKKDIDVKCNIEDRVTRKKRGIPGGVMEQNGNDPKYKALAEESLHKYLETSGSTGVHTIVTIDKVTSQGVAGSRTEIDFTVRNINAEIIKCRSLVWERLWLNKKDINVSCHFDKNTNKQKRYVSSEPAERDVGAEEQLEIKSDNLPFKYLVSGGKVSQNANDPIYKELAENCLQKYLRESNSTQHYKIVRIKKVTTQVTSGIKTRLTFIVSPTNCKINIKGILSHDFCNIQNFENVKECTAEVISIPWKQRNNDKINHVNCFFEKYHKDKRDIFSKKLKESYKKSLSRNVGSLVEQNTTKREYNILADESLRKYQELQNSKYRQKVLEVKRVFTQVVSGTIYKIDFTAVPTVCSANVLDVSSCERFDEKTLLYCHADIWNRPWLKRKKIDISCVDYDIDDNENNIRLKRGILGGVHSKDVNRQEYIKMAELATLKFQKLSKSEYYHKIVNINHVSEQVTEGFLTTIKFSISPTTCLVKNKIVNKDDCQLQKPQATLHCLAKITDRPLIGYGLQEDDEISVKCNRNIIEKNIPNKRAIDLEVREKRQTQLNEDDIDDDTKYYYADRVLQSLNDRSNSDNLEKLITVHDVVSSIQMKTPMVRMYIETAPTYCLRHQGASDLDNCDELEGINHRLCFAKIFPSPDDELTIQRVTVVCDDEPDFRRMTGLSIPDLLTISLVYLEDSKDRKYKLVHRGEPYVVPSLHSNVPVTLSFIVASTNCSKDIDIDRENVQCFVDFSIPDKSCQSFIWMIPTTKRILHVKANCSEVTRNRMKRSPEDADLTTNIKEMVAQSLQKLEMGSQHRYKQRVLKINSYSTKITSGRVTTIDFDVGYTNCLKYEWVDNITKCEFLEHLPRRHCVSEVWERLWLHNGRNIEVNCQDDETPLEAHIEFESAETAMQLAQQALKHIEAKYPHPRKQKVVRIFSLEKQNVAGLHYRMKIEVGFTNCLALSVQENCELSNEGSLNRFCRVNVWIRPWTDHTPNYRVSCDYQSGASAELYHLLQSEQLFYNFLTTYKPDYVNDHIEMTKRFEIFKDNVKKIHELNTHEGGTATYAVTRFTDLSYDEFSTKYLGLRPNLRNPNQIPMSKAKIPEVHIPDSFDWRKFDTVTEVKDQGSCGSCWAFSVTGNIEGQWKLKTGQLLSLSEQELVDCDKLDSGCNGGYMDNAYRAIEELGGLEPEDAYPYEGEDDKCSFNKTIAQVQVSGAVNISSDETDMAKWLVRNGPISIGINANAMQFYVGGISHPWKMLCNPKNLDHGVLLVGYGIKEYPLFHKRLPYWIVKNSWGPSWGEQGYYRVYRGDGTCGVNQMASSAVL